MTKAAFAKAVGRSYQNLYDLFENPSWDTGLLRRSSRALKFNFFRLLAEDLDPEVPSPAMAAEPQAGYGRASKGGVDVTIRIDPSDPEAQRKLLAALKAIGQ